MGETSAGSVSWPQVTDWQSALQIPFFNGCGALKILVDKRHQYWWQRDLLVRNWRFLWVLVETERVGSVYNIYNIYIYIFGRPIGDMTNLRSEILSIRIAKHTVKSSYACIPCIPLLCLNRSASHCMAILTRMTLTSFSRVPSQFLALLFLLHAGEHRGKNTQPLSTTYHNHMQRFERILTTTLHGWGNVQRRLGWTLFLNVSVII